MPLGRRRQQSWAVVPQGFWATDDRGLRARLGAGRWAVVRQGAERSPQGTPHTGTGQGGRQRQGRPAVLAVDGQGTEAGAAEVTGAGAGAGRVRRRGSVANKGLGTWRRAAAAAQRGGRDTGRAHAG